MLTMCCGFEESASILRLRETMWLSTTLSLMAMPAPQTASRSCSRLSTRPWLRTNAPSSLNSVALRSTCVP